MKTLTASIASVSSRPLVGRLETGRRGQLRASGRPTYSCPFAAKSWPFTTLQAPSTVSCFQYQVEVNCFCFHSLTVITNALHFAFFPTHKENAFRTVDFQKYFKVWFCYLHVTECSNHPVYSYMVLGMITASPVNSLLCVLCPMNSEVQQNWRGHGVTEGTKSATGRIRGRDAVQLWDPKVLGKKKLTQFWTIFDKIFWCHSTPEQQRLFVGVQN